MATCMVNGGKVVDLSDDAPWKKMQEKSFKRWVNMHLQKGEHYIGSLATDLSDGVHLIKLIEQLSGKILPRYNKNPCFRSQKLANVSLCLHFLEYEERINMINIDSSDIVDGNLKLILGLIWHLILHYSISKPQWEFCTEALGNGIVGNDECQTMTPLKKLLLWLQTRLPKLSIKNFTSDWADSRALGYLIHTFVPELCKDWFQWKARDALHNTTDTLELAEIYLGVQKLLKAEDIVNPHVDEYAMMTYLSQFPNAKLQPLLLQSTIIDYRKPTNVCQKPLTTEANPKRVKAFGSGLFEGHVGTVNKFTVDTSSAGNAALGFSIEGPCKAKINCINTKDLGIWAAEYTVSQPGKYRINIKYGNEPITGSPFNVVVLERKEKIGKSVPTIVVPESKTGGIMIPITTHSNHSRNPSPLYFSVTGLKNRPNVQKDGETGTYGISYRPELEELQGMLGTMAISNTFVKCEKVISSADIPELLAPDINNSDDRSIPRTWLRNTNNSQKYLNSEERHNEEKVKSKNIDGTESPALDSKGSREKVVKFVMTVQIE